MSDLISPELQSKLAAWRIKALDGTLSLEEMKESVTYLRAGRLGAAQAAQKTAATRKKAIAVIPSADDMLSDLEGL